MAEVKTRKTRKKAKKAKKPDYPLLPVQITHLGRYLEACFSVLKKDDTYWFRGHADIEWELTPSALRYSKPTQRLKALELLADFKRYGEIKLRRTPSQKEELKWVQLGQHYGLPTLLLDWTKNAAIALYFACLHPNDSDGAVYILNPLNLNVSRTSGPTKIFDAHLDVDLIEKYLEPGQSGKGSPNKIIPINPAWNSERIMLQQGVFTLHPANNPTLMSKHAPGLTCIRIQKEYKEKLLVELERVGINEMAIFPEPEHLCKYLRWRENLI